MQIIQKHTKNIQHRTNLSDENRRNHRNHKNTAKTHTQIIQTTFEEHTHSYESM